MSQVKLDFEVFLGDPDAHVPKLPSAELIKKADEHKAKLNFAEGVYATIRVDKGGKTLVESKADPLMTLLTAIVRSVPYVIDGEPERALFSESEHGFLFEPSGDGEVMVSYFAGDPYEPEEFFLEREPMSLEGFGDQVLGMADRFVTLVKRCDPDLFAKDDYSKAFMEFVDMAKKTVRTFKLERERGLRR